MGLPDAARRVDLARGRSTALLHRHLLPVQLRLLPVKCPKCAQGVRLLYWTRKLPSAMLAGFPPFWPKPCLADLHFAMSSKMASALRHHLPLALNAREMDLTPKNKGGNTNWTNAQFLGFVVRHVHHNWSQRLRSQVDAAPPRGGLLLRPNNPSSPLCAHRPDHIVIARHEEVGRKEGHYRRDYFAAKQRQERRRPLLVTRTS